MSHRSYDLIIVGLSVTSAWGNGHATTYRALLRGLAAIGLRVLFLERDVPWYANNRDLPDPDFCDLGLYDSVEMLGRRFGAALVEAQHVIVGSYVPDGVEIVDTVIALRSARTHFYDIDTPVTLAKLENGDDEYLAARQVPAFDTYFSFSGGPILARLETDFGARRARPLFCSVDPDRYAPADEPLEWDLGYLGTYSPDRQPVLERLLIEPARRLPHMRFVVAGPQYPDTIAWPENVELIDYLPPRDHRAFYCRQRFTLNITRRDMVAAGHSPSVRLFEAAACGTPIISDRWDGLREIMGGGAGLTIADTTSDVTNALAESSFNRPAAARSLRALALDRHTGVQRARELVRDIAYTSGGRYRAAE